MGSDVPDGRTEERDGKIGRQKGRRTGREIEGREMRGNEIGKPPLLNNHVQHRYTFFAGIT